MNELILGLLMISNMTSYDIRKSIQNGMNMLSSDSMGNIHSSIKKLIQLDYIDYFEMIENNKFKKVYSINETGKSYFNKWINSSIQTTVKRNLELKKIFFMGFSNDKERKVRLVNYIESLKKEVLIIKQVFDLAKKQFEQLDKNRKQIVYYQICTMEYGINLINYEIKWYEKIIINMER